MNALSTYTETKYPFKTSLSKVFASVVQVCRINKLFLISCPHLVSTMPSILLARIFTFWVLLSVLVIPLCGQSKLFDQIPSEQVGRIRISTDLKKIVKSKKMPVYQAGQVTFLEGSLAKQSYQVKIKARGSIRREICYYPPLWIRFSKSSFNHHKFKWVNVCRNDKALRHCLLREYLAYKLYQLITDHSFDVRLFEVEFTEPGTKEVSLGCNGFMIEPLKELGRRTGSTEYNPKVVRSRILQKQHYALVAIFQYLIGNTDWHIDNSHNLKFLRSRPTNSIILVPYDFDYSAFVGASYAAPHESLPIKSVRERHNKADCFTEGEVKEALGIILSKKEEMLQLIQSFKLLDQKPRQRLLRFLQEGFTVLENEKKALRIFTKNCK